MVARGALNSVEGANSSSEQVLKRAVYVLPWISRIGANVSRAFDLSRINSFERNNVKISK